MSLRWKVALAMAAMVALTAVAFGAASYRSTRARLFDAVDRSLTDVEARRINRDQLPARGPLDVFDAQVIGLDGAVRQSTFTVELPVTDADIELIGTRNSRFSTVETEAGEFRVRTVGLPGGALQVGRSLEDTNDVLRTIRARTLLIAALVTSIAAAVGLWIAGRVTASLRRLTRAAEHVEATGELHVDLGDASASGRDEVGRLGGAFERMMSALARSRDEQRRLVQDAGHELRTPLTSVRTNIATLRRYPSMPTADRDAIMADLDAETDELTSLVNEIVAVATGAAADDPVESFDLVALVAEVAQRVERRTGRVVRIEGEPTTVHGQRSAVQRAVSCLLDNAAKFDVSDGPLDVVVHPDGVTVLDRGPGIADDDLGRVFDRFHRSSEARSLPGSGLGLSIVRAVAERHGGTVSAANRPGGGAAVGFRLGVPFDPPVASG